MKGRWAAFAAAMTTITLWGMSYIWMDRLLEMEIPVEFFVPVRIALAGFLLFLLNKALRYDMAIRRKDWLKFLLLSLC
ncbi:MAG: hypothetical protein IK045_07250, partial [Bacteroidales bacterium]|nr:hypothetical protein [Bacteroidales bacterium]